MHAEAPQPSFAEIRRVLLPDNGIFLRRSERFAHLASNHALSEWLNFLSQLSRIQHEVYTALSGITDVDKPDTPSLGEDWIEHRPWQTALHQLLSIAASQPLAGPVEKAIASLGAASTERKLEIARNILSPGSSNSSQQASSAELTLVAAALQVYAAYQAHGMEAPSAAVSQAYCPCCGGETLGSIIHSASSLGQLRYQQCSVCSTRWNAIRARCTVCDAAQEVSYQEIEGNSGAIRAECCDACNTYLKIYLQEKEAAVEPTADDLASLALDVLVGEQGYVRSGQNLFLFPA